MKLQVQPLVALGDEKVSISISELPAFGKVKVRASMCLPWAPNVPFESFASFTADSNGEVDLSRQKPDSGTYDSVDSMGLIESLKRTGKGDLSDVGENISVDQSMFIDIVAERDQDRVNARLERLFMTKEIKKQKVSDEFVGELFYTENADHKTVLFLGGSGGALGPNLPYASLLASHGFNVLTVAYFKEKGLPAQLSEIPLEYFERVFTWLSMNPITKSKEIYLVGQSKGGELALLLASRYPIITKVAALAPHAYCFQGIAFKNVSSWTYGGKSLPFIQLKNRWLFGNMISCFIKNKPFGFTYTYKKGLKAAKNKEAARIRVEDAQADLRLFAGKQNNMWNSYDGCVQIMDTLRKCKYPRCYDLVVYEEAGEPPLFVPYVFPASMTKAQMAPRLTLDMGGTLEANAHEQADSWERTIEFLKK